MRQTLAFVFLTAVVVMPITPSLAAEVPTERPFKAQAVTLVGYDDNSLLNAQRDNDFFAQESLGLSYKNSLCSFTKFRLSYDVMNVNYFDVTDQNVLIQDAGAGLDFKLSSSTTFETDAGFDFIYFPNNSSVTSSAPRARAGLRQKISEDITLKGGFGVSNRQYDERKLRQADGVLSDDEERNDWRYTADAELAVKLMNTLLLRAGFVYYWNDSDDLFHDYYDFDAFKVITGAFFKLNQKINGFAKFSYERRSYYSRPLIDDSDTFQDDNVYTGTLGVFYKFTQELSLGVVHSYRQKVSNEPSQQYSGALSTLGLYYSF